MTREEATKILSELPDRIMAIQLPFDINYDYKEALTMAISALSENKGDTVSRGTYEQIMWERDIAIQQLKDLGYELGEKLKENKGEWIEIERGIKCSKCGAQIMCFHVQAEEYKFCPNCGADMRGGKSNEEE